MKTANEKKGDKFAKLSFILAIISFFSYFFLGPLNFLLNAIGIYFGRKGLQMSKQYHSTALAGIIIHIVTFVFYVYYFVRSIYPWLS
ncbi:hypothetical protein [Evansella halocellulosilytica]|uniref:hypothetical protein n=1 Tax=Evansella halocellulosilytica TaxID=2011013 RepID=UPI000BB8D5B9|nr:hypothetical protein [Evansella halocellulosilytica]